MRLVVQFRSHDYDVSTSGYDKDLAFKVNDAFLGGHEGHITNRWQFALDYQWECEVIVRPRKKETK